MSTVIVALIGVLSGLVAIYEAAQHGRRSRERRRALVWGEVDELVLEILDQIDRRSFDPAAIVGVGPGGAVIAAMVATNLQGRRPLICLPATEPGHDTATPLPDLGSANVLVVVGEHYEDDALREAGRLVRSATNGQVKTGAVLVGPRATLLPDFVGRKLDQEPVPPWNAKVVLSKRDAPDKISATSSHA